MFIYLILYFTYICDFVQDQATPLHYAATEGNFEIAKKLLEKEADVNVKDKVRFT